jgi:hypothetical protein
MKPINQNSETMRQTSGLNVLAALVFIFAVIGRAQAQSWIKTSAPQLHWWSITSSADGTKLAAVGPMNTAVFTSTNSGATWNSNYVYNAPGFTCVASSADGIKLLVGPASDVLYTSTNSGVTWVSNNVPVKTWTSVASSADGTKLVAGSGGPIYTSADSGTNWVEHNVPVTDDYPYFVWHGLASSADGTKIAAAGLMPMNYTLGHGGGLIYTSSDSGGSWQASSAPNTTWCAIACSADAKTLIAASTEEYSGLNHSSVYVSTDAGVTWNMCDTPETRRLGSTVSVDASADGTKLVAASVGSGFPGLILVSTNSGLTWSSNGSPVGAWSSVTSSADGGQLACALDGGSIYTRSVVYQPSLAIAPSEQNVRVSWIVPSSQFTLQQNLELSSTNWTDISAIPSLTNLEEQVIIPLLPGAAYYRLKGL